METGAAVAGVVSTFETGANLVQQIRKRSKKKKGEQAIKEKLLQEALESGERQISELYSRHLNESGTGIQIGDGQHLSTAFEFPRDRANFCSCLPGKTAAYCRYNAVGTYSKSSACVEVRQREVGFD